MKSVYIIFWFTYAVAHRNYDDQSAKISLEVFTDRLIVSSPGHPPGGQTSERLASGKAKSRARNPLVVQGLSWLELMDERGSGIARMTRLLEQAGHPKPLFRIDHDCLVVELRSSETNRVERSEYRKQASSTQVKLEMQPREAILAEVRAAGRISTKICVQRLGIPSASAKRLFKELVGEGILTMEGSGRFTHYRLTKPFMIRFGLVMIGDEPISKWLSRRISKPIQLVHRTLVLCASDKLWIRLVGKSTMMKFNKTLQQTVIRAGFIHPFQPSQVPAAEFKHYFKKM